MVKTKLSLLPDVENVFDYAQGTIDAYKVSQEDFENILEVVKLYLRKTKGHFSNEIINKLIQNKFERFDFVNFKKYPLPAVYNTSTKRILVNLSAIGKKDILNINPKDLYSIIVYSIICAYYTNRDLKVDLQDDISDYMSAMFMKMFAKRYGLIGSYTSEIPKLRFLVTLHTLVSFFGMKQSEAYGRAGSLSKIKITNIDLNFDEYDFSNTRVFIKSLSDSGVLHGLSVHEFAALVLRIFGSPMSIAMFEDGMRFMSSIAGGTILGNEIFPMFMEKYHPKIYAKIINNFNYII